MQAQLAGLYPGCVCDVVETQLPQSGPEPQPSPLVAHWTGFLTTPETAPVRQSVRGVILADAKAVLPVNHPACLLAGTRVSWATRSGTGTVRPLP